MIEIDPDHIKSLLRMAEQSLAEARCLGEHEHILGTINRIYYASFYAVSAMLEVNGVASSKHSGIRGIFNKEFVNTGLLNPRQGEFYNKVYKMRHASDYLTNTQYDTLLVEELLLEVQVFVNEIRVLTLTNLEKSGN